VVQGLAVNRFAGNGIGLGAYGGITATNNVIAGNHIGTNVAGTTAMGNGLSGVFIGLGANQNTVGGTAPAARNVISGNGWEGVGIHGSETRLNFVLGNYIGVDATGAATLSNGWAGVEVWGAAGNRIGGATAGERNVISGNGEQGVYIQGDTAAGNVVAGN
jgi:hypothetical protein